MIFSNVLELIGNTPIIRLKSLEIKYHLESSLFVKLEGQNIGGSIKSRSAYNMIAKALEDKKINENTTIICGTSGNLGVSLSMICSYMKLKLIVVMPKSTSKSKIDLIKKYGAKIVFTLSKSMSDVNNKIKKISKKYQNCYILDQFSNKDNFLAHYQTAQEIIEDLPNITTLIVASGSGGTITGLAQKLKEYNHHIKTILVEPSESPFIGKGIKGKHKIEGIGPNFIPDILDLEYVDDVLNVSFKEVLDIQNELILEEGLFLGYSSCASLAAALKYAIIHEKQTILSISADYGERYLF